MQAVVLLSGGVDSAVVLASALGAAMDPVTLTVDYGQVHRREIGAARSIAEYYDVPHHVVKVDPVLFGRSALVDPSQAIPERHAASVDATYVPARNTVLIAVAAAQAESTGAKVVLIGCNGDDAAGYPDCRRQFIEAYREVLILGTACHVWLDAPLVGMTKREILKEAKRLAVPLHLTWSCYRGGDEPCGACGACEMLVTQ